MKNRGQNCAEINIQAFAGCAAGRARVAGQEAARPAPLVRAVTRCAWRSSSAVSCGCLRRAPLVRLDDLARGLVQALGAVRQLGVVPLRSLPAGVGFNTPSMANISLPIQASRKSTQQHLGE